MSMEPERHTLEALIDELARVLHDAGEARELAVRAGFAKADLPTFDKASVFWGEVVREADAGRTLGGIAAVVEQAKVKLPGNRFFEAYGSAPATASTQPVLRPGTSIDNLGEQPPIFVGRDDELERIHEALTSDGTAARFSAVVGLGGVGKSRLALEHAFHRAAEYDVRWWVRAGASASVQEDLVRLGQRLGLFGEVVDVERAVDEVLHWLSKHERWLLVLDNAEGPDELRKALGGPLTLRGAGHVLITSRAQAWRGLAKPIEITTLAPEAAHAVLLERSGRDDDGFADAVAERLGFLPLALVQAGAYVEATRSPFGKYLERLERVGLALFEDPKAATGDYYRQTVAATWSINLGELRNGCPAAADLLDWLAFLDPDGVPVRLLREHGNARPPGAPACLASEDHLDAAIAALRGYSMVDRVEQPEDALRVHRLVQAVTRDELGDERRRELAAAVVAWVTGVFAYDPQVKRIKDVPEGIGEQLMAVSIVGACVATSGDALTEALSMLSDYRVRRGMLAAARTAGERSLEVAEGLVKADGHSPQAQRGLSVSLNKLGNVEVEAGNLAAARDLFQRSREVAEGLAKADGHSPQAQRDLSVSLNNLGRVEAQARNLAAARDFFQCSLQIREGLAKADGHSPQAQRDLSVSLERLGKVEVEAGNLATARDLFQRSLQVAEGLAKADPHSARAQRDLSITFEKLGNVEVKAGNHAAARDLFQRSFTIKEGLAKADPHSALAAFDLCTSHRCLARVAKAQVDRDSQNHHLNAARSILDAMEARGQYRGYAAFDQARRDIDGELGDA